MARFGALLLLTIIITSAHALSVSPKGTAATPLKKQSIAVFGAGGYLGSYIFGYLQRASTLYGTGIGTANNSPRGICATALSSLALNKVLSKNFVLSYAGEQHMRLTDMSCVDAIASRLQGYSAVVIGTMYHLEPRPITGGSYEKGPNDKTVEFYLDQPKRTEISLPGSVDDIDLHLQIFDNTLAACQKAGVKHTIVIETPKSSDDAGNFLSRLQNSKIPFTYIRLNGDLTNSQDHSYIKGVIQRNLSVDTTSLEGLLAERPSVLGSNKGSIYREDVAALVCQCLQSLSWTRSRCLTVQGKNESAVPASAIVRRPDREWCVNSKILADLLALVE